MFISKVVQSISKGFKVFQSLQILAPTENQKKAVSSEINSQVSSWVRFTKVKDSAANNENSLII